MLQQSRPTRRDDIKTALVWALATPVLPIWAMVSLLPAVGAISAWGDPGRVLAQLVFFGTGAVALVLAYLVSLLLLQPGAPKPSSSRALRLRRVAWLTGYGLLWLTSYGFYSLL